VAMFVGTVAAARYEDESATRPENIFLSTWSILWDSLVEFKDKVGVVLKDSIVDVMEAAKATTILARCLISVLHTVGEVKCLTHYAECFQRYTLL
jgi:hypothetical protein